MGTYKSRFGFLFFVEIGYCTNSEVNLINALIWIVKALAMRSHGDLDLWVEKVY